MKLRVRWDADWTDATDFFRRNDNKNQSHQSHQSNQRPIAPLYEYNFFKIQNLLIFQIINKNIQGNQNIKSFTIKDLRIKKN